MICVECGTHIEVEDHCNPFIIDCPLCGTELEINDNDIIGLHLGPSEE